ncbi:hypothetical protein CEW83_12665 [Parazoarcus communis]|uniref:DUF2946 domain-containing protein n=1 Tax=Parazoarcus communis TaxID=41977 RepID=A0A2U8GSI0_9RHOO|nr:DUF2946 family protein [Parazoarcus communis]AWI75966.1 hypothetical protein CEW83_12665 [Parazoarcus communis]
MPAQTDLPPEWPVVPACYGWLSLDRRGVWRLRGEPVVHPGLSGFISANYEADEHGNWLVNNGPQKVFVTLDYTPWVMRLDADGTLHTHTGRLVGEVEAVHLDDEGNVLLATAVGLGLLSDRDLPAFLAGCRLANGGVADDEALLGVMAGKGGVFWRGMPLTRVAGNELAARYHFNAAPAQ